MKAVQLLKPCDGAITPPFQAFPWPGRPDDPGSADTAPGAVRWNALEAVAEDRSIPLPVCFEWKGLDAPSDGCVYELLVSTDSEFGSAQVFQGIHETCCNVFNLHIGSRYFWKIAAWRHGARVSESPVWSFQTNATPPRWLRVPGINNVRDIGGWPLPGNRRVRQGLIYRSSEMNSHVEISEEGRRVLIEDLKIRTDLDLRGQDEEVRPVLDQASVKWINIPVRPYEHIVEEPFHAGYRDVFGVLADPSAYPVLLHCWGGCDRAGTVVFLLHALLGMDREILIRDYELSSLAIWGDRLCSAEYFQALLEVLASFDDGQDNTNEQAERYLVSAGVTEEQIAAIRENLVENPE